MFQLGLNTKCPSCELTFWSHLDNVKTNSTCEFCGHVFNILLQFDKRNWEYRRLGIFGLNDDQAGGIPVILTLNQLQLHFRNNFNSFIYSTALKIEQAAGDRKQCEVDFLIITSDHAGKVSIIIAECKNGCPIDEKDINNLQTVANSLTQLNVSSYILVSKLTVFTKQKVSIVQQYKGSKIA